MAKTDKHEKTEPTAPEAAPAEPKKPKAPKYVEFETKTFERDGKLVEVKLGKRFEAKHVELSGDGRVIDRKANPDAPPGAWRDFTEEVWEEV